MQFFQLDRIIKITKLSKTFAVILFILLPFYGFFIGIKYQQFKNLELEESNKITKVQNTNYEFLCSNDSDCVLVDSGPCSCNYGGGKVSINKLLKENWEKTNQELAKDRMCAAMVSSDPSCGPNVQAKCIQNECTLIYN